MAGADLGNGADAVVDGGDWVEARARAAASAATRASYVAITLLMNSSFFHQSMVVGVRVSDGGGICE